MKCKQSRLEFEPGSVTLFPIWITVAFLCARKEHDDQVVLVD